MSRRVLSRLLEPGALSVLFQPIFDVGCEEPRVFALECLVRGPRGTPLENAASLFEFVRRRHAEIPMDRACLDAALRAAGPTGPSCPVAVNVHGLTLGRDHEFLPFLADAAERYGVPLNRVIIEIVGQPPSWYTRSLMNNIEGLKAVGVRVAVDLGAGASGYRAILDCRPEYLKLDRYLVTGAHTDFYRRAVVRSIAALARTLGARVVAEGIEDPLDLAALRALGIDLAQGHVFSEAVPSGRLAQSGILAECGGAA